MVKMETFESREDWLKGRHRIGGSDASAVLGLNPWMTNAELFQIKTGSLKKEDISDKAVVKFGIEAEPLMRELFKLDYPQYKVDYVENNLWTNSKFEFAHASLDGWLTDPNGRKGIWECKTVNILQAGQTEKWKDAIPDYYYCQLLHYFLVTEFEFAILKARLRWEAREDKEVYCQIKHYKIERSEVEEDIELLAEAEEKFYKSVQENKRPDLILPEI